MERGGGNPNGFLGVQVVYNTAKRGGSVLKFLSLSFKPDGSLFSNGGTL